MISKFKQHAAITSTVVVALLSTISSASAVTISQPKPGEGCFCGGRYFPPQICRAMKCVDLTDRRPLDFSFNKPQLPTIVDESTFVAGRYRTRGPGAGIDSNIEAV